jgi:hypothetical protein
MVASPGVPAASSDVPAVVLCVFTSSLVKGMVLEVVIVLVVLVLGAVVLVEVVGTNVSLKA